MIENPTEASPDTNEQLLMHESEILNHGVKTSFPPSCKISFGLALPQVFFNITLTTIRRLNKTAEKINKTSLLLKLKLKYIFLKGKNNVRQGINNKYNIVIGRINCLINIVIR